MRVRNVSRGARWRGELSVLGEAGGDMAELPRQDRGPGRQPRDPVSIQVCTTICTVTSVNSTYRQFVLVYARRSHFDLIIRAQGSGATFGGATRKRDTNEGHWFHYLRRAVGFFFPP